MTNRKSKVPAGAANVFSTPRYVWLFQCSSRLALHAATLDRRGGNLPVNLCAGGGAWKVCGQMVVGPDARSSPVVDVQALKVAIEKDGYYLWNADAEPPGDGLRLMR
jgi:uncharacterized protein YcgL (UPF0745 family)